MNRVLIGEHAAAAVCDRFRVVFLRQGTRIVSILHAEDDGVVSVVIGENGSAEYCKCLHGVMTADSEAAQAAFAAHAADRFTDTGDCLIWQCADGMEYPMTLCEAADGTAPEGDGLAQKMARWNQKAYTAENGEDGLCAEIITERFAAVFLCRKDMIYCRLGQNGYCDKGYAMLSGIVLRRNECRMRDDLSAMRQPYHPQESCFAENACAFPTDGGWYWSVREVTETEILLNGCGGEIYSITKPEL